MFAKLQKQFGTAGLVLSVLAIVLALGGGAYAANHATASKAKQGKQGKPGKNGTNGTNGAPGATGPAGPAGATGPAGTPGSPGAPGASVEVTALQPGECANGQAGARFEVGTEKAEACEGNPAEYPETLPPGKTEKGLWAVNWPNSIEGEVKTAISFQLPLASEPEPQAGIGSGHAVYVLSGHPAGCPGDAANPSAEPGYLCVYQYQSKAGRTFETAEVEGFDHAEAATQLGAWIHFYELSPQPGYQGDIWLDGSWAVTAPPEP